MAFDMDTVSPCSPLVLPCRAAHLVSFFYIPSRLASRRFVSPCVPFSLLTRGIRHDFHMGAVSPCLPLAVSSCVPLGVSIRACCLASRLVAFLSCVPLLRLIIAFRFPHSLRSSPFVFARLRSSLLVSVRHPLAAFFLRHRFVLLFAHFYSFPAPLPGTLLSFPLVFFLICAFPVASRLSSRPLVSSCRLVLVRPVRRPACRVVGSSRLFVSLVVFFLRRFVLLFARSRLAWAWRSCLAFSCRLVFSLVSRPVLASRCGVPLVISSRSRLVIRLPVGVSCPFSGPVPVFAPFRPARRSFLFAYSVLGSLVLVSVMRQGGASWP